MENKIDVVLTPENKEAIFQEIRNAKSGMPYLIKMSEDDRKFLHKVDDGCKPFVQKCLEEASVNPGLDPGSDLLKSVRLDIELYSFLSVVENQLRQLLDMVDDTRQLAGSDANDIAKIIYMKAKMNLKLGVPGSQEIVDELSKLCKPICTHTHLISLHLPK